MSAAPRRLRLLRVAVALMLVFDLMALVVLARVTPIAFTLFMFLAQPLFAAALLLLAVAAIGEARGRQDLPGGQSHTSR
jgi:hypothetical protein